MTIQELREKRTKAWDTARDFLDSKRNANGVLSEEDSKTYDAMEQTIVDLGKEIQRLERQAEIEAEMNKRNFHSCSRQACHTKCNGKDRYSKRHLQEQLSGTASETAIGSMSTTICTLAQTQRAAILCRTSLCACKRRCLQ